MKPILLSTLFLALSVAHVYPFLARDDTTCTVGQMTCSDDCTSIKICLNKDEPSFVNCANQSSGRKPYCDEAGPQCTESSEACTSHGGGGGAGNDCENLKDGYYPELLDCKKYYYCNNKKKLPYTCDGSTFNPATGLCQVGIQCYTFSDTSYCRGHTGNLIAHPLVKTIYIYCAPDNKPKLLQCQYDHFEFDTNIGNCKFVCPKAGRFPDPENASNDWYYECIQDGYNYILHHNKCPDGTKFDEGKGTCLQPTSNFKIY